jgi:lipopolysaccharide export system permease LptF/LptG-like protein
MTGDRLRALAARVCHAAAMERLIDPVIADLQCEHADAIRRGRVWLARRVRFTGYLAFVKVLSLHAAARSLPLAREWVAADQRAVGRTIACSAASIAIATVLLTGLLLSELIPHVIHADGWGGYYAMVSAGDLGRLLFYVVPLVLPLATLVGFAPGVLFALRGRAGSRRLRWSVVAIAAGCSLLLCVMAVWVAPAANEALKGVVTGGPAPRPPSGPTLVTPMTTGQRYQSYEQWASSLGTIVLGLFAYSVSVFGRGRVRPLIVGVTASFGYVLLYFLLAVPVLTGWVPPLLAAWIPNLMFAIVTAALLRSSNPQILKS